MSLESKVKEYLLIYFAIILLLGLNLGLSFVTIRNFNFPIELTIALAQDVLIWLFYMELKGDRTMSPIFGLAGVAWLIILVTLALSDFVTRGWLLFPAKWPVTMHFSPPLGS